MAKSAPSGLVPEGIWRGNPLLHRLAASHTLLDQAARYGLVSVAALGSDFAVFLLLTAAGTQPTLAGAVGYAVGLVLHFLLSTLCVFDAMATAKPLPRLFGEFALSGAVGLALTAAVITVMTNLLQAAPVLAKAVAVIVSFAVVFLLRRHMVFAARFVPR